MSLGINHIISITNPLQDSIGMFSILMEYTGELTPTTLRKAEFGFLGVIVENLTGKSPLLPSLISMTPKGY
jgi:hypothetical protein